MSLLSECIPTRLQCARVCVCFPAKGVTAGVLCPPVTKRLRLLEYDQPLTRLPTLLHLLLLPYTRLLGDFNLPPPPPLFRLPLHMGLVSHGKRSVQLEAAASWAAPPFFQPSSPATLFSLGQPQPPALRRPTNQAVGRTLSAHAKARGGWSHLRRDARVHSPSCQMLFCLWLERRQALWRERRWKMREHVTQIVSGGPLEGSLT